MVHETTHCTFRFNIWLPRFWNVNSDMSLNLPDKKFPHTQNVNNKTQTIWKTVCQILRTELMHRIKSEWPQSSWFSLTPYFLTMLLPQTYSTAEIEGTGTLPYASWYRQDIPNSVPNSISSCHQVLCYLPLFCQLLKL